MHAISKGSDRCLCEKFGNNLHLWPCIVKISVKGMMTLLFCKESYGAAVTAAVQIANDFLRKTKKMRTNLPVNFVLFSQDELPHHSNVGCSINWRGINN